MNPDFSDQERIQQYLLSNTNSSFESLYNGYIRKAYKQCISLLTNAEIANTIAQSMMVPVETDEKPSEDYPFIKWSASNAKNKEIPAQDTETFSLFYNAYAPLLFGFIRRSVGDPIEAEQILETTFLKAWPALTHYKAAEENLLTWLLPIAYSAGLPRP